MPPLWPGVRYQVDLIQANVQLASSPMNPTADLTDTSLYLGITADDTHRTADGAYV